MAQRARWVLAGVLGLGVAVWAAPIHDACRAGDVAEAKRLLDAEPKLLDALDAEGATPLHSAAAANQADAVRLLLDRHADPDATNARRMTPLHLAALKLSGGAIALLAKRGADVGMVDSLGLRPIDYLGGKPLAAAVEALTAAEEDALRRLRAGDRDDTGVWLDGAPWQVARGSAPGILGALPAGGSLIVGGGRYGRGLALLGQTTLTTPLDGSTRRLRMVVGLHDTEPAGATASLTITLNGQPALRVAGLTPGQARLIALPTGNATQLGLSATPDGAGQPCLVVAAAQAIGTVDAALRRAVAGGDLIHAGRLCAEHGAPDGPADPWLKDSPLAWLLGTQPGGDWPRLVATARRWDESLRARRALADAVWLDDVRLDNVTRLPWTSADPVRLRGHVYGHSVLLRPGSATAELAGRARQLVALLAARQDAPASGTGTLTFAADGRALLVVRGCHALSEPRFIALPLSGVRTLSVTRDGAGPEMHLLGAQLVLEAKP